MGGDFGPRSIVQASIACLSATPSLHLTLVGQPSLLEELISGQTAVDRARLTITPASEVITMDEKAFPGPAGQAGLFDAGGP